MASSIPQSNVQLAQKRARVELNERTGFSRDAEFWFHDGSIVLVAAKDRVAFRVHKSVLSIHSPVFRDIFSIPQPDALSSEDAIEGCTVVNLHGSSDDILQLLRVLYDPRRHFRRYEGVSFALRQDALECMYTTFPKSFLIWESQYGAPGRDMTGFSRPQLLLDFVEDEAINLARLIGEPSLIPAALYRCCVDEAQVLVNHAIYESLSEDDLRRCVDARTRLVHEAHLIAYAVYMAGPADFAWTSRNASGR